MAESVCRGILAISCMDLCIEPENFLERKSSTHSNACIFPCQFCRKPVRLYLAWHAFPTGFTGKTVVFVQLCSFIDWICGGSKEKRHKNLAHCGGGYRVYGAASCCRLVWRRDGDRAGFAGNYRIVYLCVCCGICSYQNNRKEKAADICGVRSLCRSGRTGSQYGGYRIWNDKPCGIYRKAIRLRETS